MSHCEKCGKELSHNEIGASKKFINRASTSFLCRECLAARFNIPPEFIDSKIEQLKKQGCTLFV